jgi:enediyne biosynthesis protein E4
MRAATDPFARVAPARPAPWNLAGLALCFAALAAETAAAPIKFVDVTLAAGIRFRHENGATGKKYLPETMGSGGAFLDYDRDGWPDIFLVNSRKLEGPRGRPTSSALYRNQRDGTFRDVTQAAGLAVELYGMGVTAADVDNDGWLDIFVTAIEGNRLFRNLGDGRFADVTQQAGVGKPAFGTSTLFLDYDRDGRVDLFVANYVEWTRETDIFCTLDGRRKSYCTPESYLGVSPFLYRNLGNARFADVTKLSGLFDPSSKALGVAVLDYDDDGWLDLVVANDTQPNKLHRNQGDGTFVDVGLAAGIAFGDTGVARGAMGVDAADYSGTGRPDILIGNFSNEMIGLYHNEGNGVFIDMATVSGVGQASLLTLAFAVVFFDYDLDGWLDIFTANGHVADDIDAIQPNVTHAQRPHLFRNLGNGRFKEMVGELGPDFARPLVARGSAYGDYDNDGDLDLLVTQNGESALLFRNDGGNANHYLRVRTQGVRSNKDGIGARVIVTLPDGRRLWRLVHTGSSYCSQSELPLTFGLGSHPRVRALEVSWPSGQIDRLTDVPANQVVTVREGQGAVAISRLPAAGRALPP